METPQISRSGRVLKKSAKVKEMEDFDINELDAQGKASRKPKTMEDFDEYDDKRVAPIKIPKISLNVQKGGQKRMSDMPSSAGKQIFRPTFHNALKSKQEIRQNIYNDSSDGSKESDSSSVSSESSSSSPSSSDGTDDEDPFGSDYQKKSLNMGMQSMSVRQDKVIVEQNQQRYESPAYMEPSSDMSSDESEDGGSDPALVIAEDSDESGNYTPKGQRGNIKKKVIGKKDPSYAPRQGGGRKKAPAKNIETSAAKKKKPAAKSKPLSAYMLWCSENRKKIIAASAGKIGFGTINKAMGEAWQALSEKEKMAWKRKAKRLALKTSGNVITTGASNAAQNKIVSRTAASITDDLLKGLSENTGSLSTAPIDVAAHLKLLGDSLTVIGQRLIEHEDLQLDSKDVTDIKSTSSGQLAVSGIYSVLLDTLLCAIGPLLCLTTEITGLESLNRDTLKKTLDHIAYFMPGL